MFVSQTPSSPAAEDSINDLEMETACLDSAQDSSIETVTVSHEAVHQPFTTTTTVCMTPNHDTAIVSGIEITCQSSSQQSEVATVCPVGTHHDLAPDLEMEICQDSIQESEVAVGDHSNSSLNSKADNDDDIFIKPQTTYIRGKQKKTQDIIQSQLTNKIYDNPQPSSSKVLDEIPLNTSTMEENKRLPNTEEEYSHCQPSISKRDTNIHDVICLKKRVELFAAESGPQMYVTKGNLVTRPIITKNLPEIFQYLPVCGKPGPDTNLQQFFRNKVREYVGCDLDDDDFNDLENYCNPDLLKTGQELQMQSSVPLMGVVNTSTILHNNFSKPSIKDAQPNLITLKKHKIRTELDVKGLFIKKLKYRGVKILPFTQEAKNKNNKEMASQEGSQESKIENELNPGEDILYRVRVYRPYTYTMAKDRYTRIRHSVFSCDIVLTGRHKLTALRDRFVCHNDFDMRVDVSDNPDTIANTKAKDLFPSGFLFINNVFYVDTRPGCIDYSAPIREWANKRKLGDYPKKDMGQVTLQELVLKLGYPEVYVHQGNCEHVFVFSEIRLLSPTDPLSFSNYPCSTAIGQNQTVYCTTCAEFSAKWIIVGSDRVPFDPGFICDTCFKQYMYINGKKIGNFKAYRYRGNALNMLKP